MQDSAVVAVGTASPPKPTPSAPDRRGTGTALAARLRSFRHAWSGIRFLLHNEPNARLHIVASAMAVTSGLWFQISSADWRWIILAIGLVWSAEALNTAIEQVCNLVSPGPNETVKVAKDVASGAVLLSAIAAAAIGAATFLPYLQQSAPMPTTAEVEGPISEGRDR